MYPFHFTGVCTTQYLKRTKFPVGLLNKKVESGDLRQIRTRWYASSDATGELIAVVRNYCLLSGVHALSYYGGWIPHQPRHQAIQISPKPITDYEGEVIRSHRVPVSKAPYGVVPWKIAMRHAMPHLELAEQVAVVEGLLNPNTLLEVPRDELLHYLGTRRWGMNILTHLDLRSESGLETVTRVRLVQLGHKVEIQRTLPNNQRMDVLIDNKVALEIDSKHHADPGQYARDNRKAILIANQRYIPLRASYHDIMESWDLVYRAIVQMLAR